VFVEDAQRRAWLPLSQALTLVLFASSFSSPPAQYTFGGVSVGGGTFRERFNEAVPNAWRVVNNGDVVPRLLTGMGFRHVGRCAFVNERGIYVDRRSRRIDHLDGRSEVAESTRSVEDHMAMRYLRLIET
jgi:hypothetical protein